MLPKNDNEYVRKVREFAETEGSDVIVVCAKLEAGNGGAGR